MAAHESLTEYKPLGATGLRTYQVTFNASGDTFTSGLDVNSYQYSLVAITGVGTTPQLEESSGVFTFTCVGCTAGTVNLWVYANK